MEYDTVAHFGTNSRVDCQQASCCAWNNPNVPATGVLPTVVLYSEILQYFYSRTSTVLGVLAYHASNERPRPESGVGATSLLDLIGIGVLLVRYSSNYDAKCNYDTMESLVLVNNKYPTNIPTPLRSLA